MPAVLMAIAARQDTGIGGLVAGIVLHGFEGKSSFKPERPEYIEQVRLPAGRV